MKTQDILSKFILMMVALSIFISLFAGCGMQKADSVSTSTVIVDKQASTAAEVEKPKELPKGTVNVWTWETLENEQKVIDGFNKDFPDVKIVYTSVQSADMEKKILAALASGSDVPDVAWLEETQRGYQLSLNCWEDLSKAPYNVDKSNILDYMIPKSVTDKGELVGLEVSPSVCGVAYRRDLAKKYLGTDDPGELEKMLPDWNAVIKKSSEVQQASDKKVYMFAGLGDIKTILIGQNAVPFVDGNKLNLKASVGPMLSQLLEMKNKGVADTLEMWSPEWNSSFADGKHIFYPFATWSDTWVIKANDKDGKGRWGAMKSPGGYFSDMGTIVAIPKKAKNKDAAFAYINWCYLSDKGAMSNRDNLGYFNTMKSTYKDANFYTKPDEFYNGQDILKFFAHNVMPNVPESRKVTKYDADVYDALNLVLKVINTTPDKANIEELLKKMQDDISTKYPELQKE